MIDSRVNWLGRMFSSAGLPSSTETPLINSAAPVNQYAFEAPADGRPLAYSISISIVFAFHVFYSFIRGVHSSSEDTKPAEDADASPSSRVRSTENYNRFQEFVEYLECMKQHNVKDLDAVWITFTDAHLEDRFVRMASQSTLSHVLVPMACVCFYVLSELFFDRSWEVRPSIHIWNHNAAIVLNVCSIVVLASCYLLYSYFSQVACTMAMQHGASVCEVEKLLVASVVWVVSLVLFFGTRSRVCNVFYVSEREVFGSMYDFPANDEVSILQTLTFTLIVFSVYVPMRFYYLLHLGVILAVLYPFSLCLHGSAAPAAHVFAFYLTVATSMIGQRHIETQRRGTFQAMLRSLDARMDLEFEEVTEPQVVQRTALEKLLSNLRTVDRVFMHLEERARRHSTVGGMDAWGIARKHMERSRKCIDESREILSNTEGFYALNVETMFEGPELVGLDTVDFKRYMKTECGQAGHRKMYDGKMSERKATALLQKWNSGARVSVRRDTYQSHHRELLKSHPTDLQLMELHPSRSKTTVDTRQTGDKFQIHATASQEQLQSQPANTVPSGCSVDISGVGVDWNFDTLSLGARTGNRSLIFIGEKTVVPLSEQVFPCVESIELMRLFVRRIWAYYLPDNPYHNEAHAATVCHMAQYLFNNSRLDALSSAPERMGMLIAALGHDCGHFGRNNLFCQNSGHSVAFLYNDYAVLESMHAAITIRLLATGDSDCMALLDILTFEQRRAFKSTVISFIMETDMYKHYEALSKFRCKIAGADWCLEQTGCRASLGKMIMKAADVGQAAVKWDLHLEWSMRVLAEFFEQGDEETLLRLPVSTLCDRGTYDLPSAQKFFADVLCCPMFIEIRNVAVSDENRAAMDGLINEVCSNRDRWSSWAQEFPWDPKKHHWPPTKWWGQDWKKHTPTGKVLLGDKNKVNNSAMPYACDQQLRQNTTVKSHLELITRYNPGARANGYDGPYSPKDWNHEARDNSPNSSRSSGAGPSTPFGRPASRPASNSESDNSCSSFVCDLNSPSNFIDPKRLTTSSAVTNHSPASKSMWRRGVSTDSRQTGALATGAFRAEDASTAERRVDDDRADARKRMSSVNSANIEAAQRRFTENSADFRLGNA